MSSQTKTIVTGDEKTLVEYLQKLCCNNVDLNIGQAVSTGMLNENGESVRQLIIDS